VPGAPNTITRTEITDILAKPLSLGDAERLSIEVNALMKAQLASIGIAAADYAQAGRMENPGFVFERFATETYSTSILFDIGGLLLIPLKRELELRRLEVAKYQASSAVLQHLADTRRAWFEAVAQNEQLGLMMTALESAEVSNKLIRQMTALGHSSVSEAAESEILLGDMRAAVTRQRLAEGKARETLIQKIGLWGDAARALTVPDRLPALPKKPLSVSSVEGIAINTRLDVEIAKLNLEATGENYKLTRLNPFLSAIELGPVREKAEGEKERGFELEMRLPIFDPGDIKNRKALYIYEQAKAQAQNTAIMAASDARQALAAYHSAWDIANSFQTTILPMRERLNKEQLLQYNGMLISVFDLLSDVRKATTTHINYVNSVRDFWIADANLQSSMTGAGATNMNLEGATGMPGADGDGGGH